ncbi:hypothetical protein A6769_31255 [Nostoc punctiforme NIES-2108]|uniref:Transposase Helix-turn-helix domain-containing protein n=1 Tax=Nostoc punctiforme NIES-2108 TaxID=1356359 RepID=A0A367R450_NOSPU|nr:hypothetical protein A6769_31255 [Nostoc punctiforme NIES-2108]
MAEKRHLEKCAEIESNKTRIIAPGGGRKPEISSKEGICLCLIYLRQKPIFEILGLLFDVSNRTYATGTNSGQGCALPHDNLNQTKHIRILGRFNC